MLDVEYVEELLCVSLEGIQDKKDCIDDFCEKYVTFTDIDIVRRDFLEILGDIEKIFSNGFDISKTRFKQKSDFYSFFSCINDFHKNKCSIVEEKIGELQVMLAYLDENIEPHSEIEELSEYAIRCISDANSLGSRKWRTEFLKERIKTVYLHESVEG